MIKKTLCIFLLVFNSAFSQTLEDKMDVITTKISTKLKSKTNYNIAVYPFSHLKNNETELALFFFDEFHTSIQSKESGFSVMDRETIETYLEEHELNLEEGLIDSKTAKEFGMLIAADAYVTGKVFVFGSVIKLSIKLTDTETGEIIAFNSEKLPIDYDMAQFLGIENWQEQREEAEENKSQNSKCRNLNVGDYCFKNNRDIPVEIRLLDESARYGYTKKLRLQPQLKSCFKDLKSGSYSYGVYKMVAVGPATRYDVISQGNFSIKTCEAKLQDVVSSSSDQFTNEKVEYETSLGTVVIKIINPNHFPRKVIFKNSSGKTESIIVGRKSESEIQLPKNSYNFYSQTIITKYTTEKYSLTLKKNKTIRLKNDNFN